MNAQNDFLKVARYIEQCNSLGPGRRGVIWTQGCPNNCRGCVSPEMRSLDGGEQVKIDFLVDFFLDVDDIEGLTFSGGEPTCQATGLNRLIDRLREKRDLTMMSYTGFLYENLLNSEDKEVRGFLSRLDLLIDGPYIEELHCDRLWRGSSNQRILFLSDRYNLWKDKTDSQGAGLEFRFKSDGSFFWMGVPKIKNFQQRLNEQLKNLQIIARDKGNDNEHR